MTTGIAKNVLIFGVVEGDGAVGEVWLRGWAKLHIHAVAAGNGSGSTDAHCPHRHLDCESQHDVEMLQHELGCLQGL